MQRCRRSANGSLFRPFKNFADLPIDEKRRLISSRFQEIKVQDGRVASLYLLTGQVVAPRPKDPTKCGGCTRQLSDSEKRYGCENYCARCWDESLDWKEGQREEQERRQQERLEMLYPVSSRLEAFSDTFPRLQPRRHRDLKTGASVPGVHPDRPRRTPHSLPHLPHTTLESAHDRLSSAQLLIPLFLSLSWPFGYDPVSQ
jgi:hypothetical protein